jgi:predicted DNA-binding transcriptional regulator AlpA
MLCNTTPPPVDRLLRLNEVCELTALKKTTVYKRIRLRQFPQQTQIGAPGAQRGTARWTLSAVSEWIEAQKSGQNWASTAPPLIASPNKSRPEAVALASRTVLHVQKFTHKLSIQRANLR